MVLCYPNNLLYFCVEEIINYLSILEIYYQRVMQMVFPLLCLSEVK